MDHAELRSLFAGILNRSDCTETQVDMFLGLGLSRVERKLRTQLQTKMQSLVVSGVFEPVEVPADYLAMRSLKVGGNSLIRASEFSFEGECSPPRFIIQNQTFDIRPTPAEGDLISLSYYAAFDRTEDENGETRYSLSIPDVVVYAALVYASDFFVDDRMPTFEARFQLLLQEVQEMSDAEEMSGGLIMPYAEGVA